MPARGFPFLPTSPTLVPSFLSGYILLRKPERKVCAVGANRKVSRLSLEDADARPVLAKSLHGPSGKNCLENSEPENWSRVGRMKMGIRYILVSQSRT